MHRPRRYSELGSVPKNEFFDVVAEGMDAIAVHVAELVAAATRCLAAGDAVAAEIIAAIAREEAGKFLILLDAVRIPQRDQGRVTSQLKRAGDHLAKSLYFEMTDLSPATLSEVEGYFAMARQSHYLDGPNDADWVFRNRSLAHREDAMYVDYQETDDGFVWHRPTTYGSAFGLSGTRVFDLVASMRASGFCEPSGLEVMNRIWGSVVPTNGTDGSDDSRWADIESFNRASLECLLSEEVIEAIDDIAARRIIDRWTFPLHSVELSLIDTTKTVGEEQRKLLRAALWDAADYGDVAAEMWEDGPADVARDMFGGSGGDELELRAEMARARKEFVAAERTNFINEQ